MHKKHEVCMIKECGRATRGKQYCEKHMAVGQRRKLTSALSVMIRSDCCTAKCVVGAVHENGEQYCTKCKEPCCWKTEKLAAPRGTITISVIERAIDWYKVLKDLPELGVSQNVTRELQDTH